LRATYIYFEILFII